jgi:hypothetical protein
MKLTQLALLASFTLISSCSILPKPEPFDVYRAFGRPGARLEPVHAMAQRWSLRLNKLQASEALNQVEHSGDPTGRCDQQLQGFALERSGAGADAQSTARWVSSVMAE